MRINTNIPALNAFRMNTSNEAMTAKSLQKLSSGLRITHAGDDAAGLAISEKMRGQIRGLGQAARNIQDGISLIQTAEGAMQEVHSLLQRGRELSVQAANGTLTVSDKNDVQQEVNQILMEIDKIANTTSFNTINLLNAPGADAGTMGILTGLKSAWLQQSEAIITANYGLTADGVQLSINIVKGAAGGTLAYVAGSYNGATGLGTNLTLNIEEADFAPASLPNGTNPYGAVYDDRIIAHELTHAVMSRTMNFLALPTWFVEGSAEFTSGADERLYGDSGNGTNFAGVVNEIASWEGSSADYSSAYAAVRYLHAQLKAAGGAGIKDVMIWLNANQPADLNAAFAAMKAAHPALAFNSVASFVSDYQTNGVAFLTGLNTAGDFTNPDTGAIGGADADGGASKDAASVVPDTVNYTADPLAGFQEIWPTTQSSTPLGLQLGANAGQTLDFSLCDLRSTAIGLGSVDVVNQASGAITAFDSAIGSVSSERGRLGAIQNRLEHALAISGSMEENLTEGESRIRDADMAKEMMAFTKASILAQASTSMLTQANQQPQAVLQLLRAG